ncbi:MAG: protein ImuB [Mycobacteriales bacterium]|jgi:protein ImuB
MALRTVVLWCPDWPVISAAGAVGVPPTAPIAVIWANRVVSCSAAARAEGVRRGLRRREAQGRCPDLVVLRHDPIRDARAFEPVLAAVEELAPGVEAIRPGLCAVAARGPARYFGGDRAVAARLIEHVTAVTRVASQVGVADGRFAAGLAARGGEIVPRGGSRAFLAPFPVGTLELPELTDLLRRLGLRTLGAFAELPPRDVLARFGPDGARAHRLARGMDEVPLAARVPAPELAMQVEFDPPVDRVDTAAFAARALAEQLHAGLTRRGLACTRLAIEAQTEHGEQLTRLWRHEGVLTPAAIAERVRWQLDGWLTRAAAGAAERPTAGIMLLRLVPDEVIRHSGLQLGLWGGLGDAGERASRAMARVQGMLGGDAVLTAVLGGGRDPDEQVRLVPWGDERAPARPADQPWPGQVPAPAPATVLTDPVPVEVVAADGSPVGVTGRYAVTAEPARFAAPGRPATPLLAWAGPWPVDERWWDPAAARRRARFQLLGADGTAWLVALEAGRWWAEGIYE